MNSKSILKPLMMKINHFRMHFEGNSLIINDCSNDDWILRPESEMMKMQYQSISFRLSVYFQSSLSMKFNQFIETNLPESITDGSKSTKIALGTWRPDPVDEKKVEKESSDAETESALSMFSKFGFHSFEFGIYIKMTKG